MVPPTLADARCLIWVWLKGGVFSRLMGWDMPKGWFVSSSQRTILPIWYGHSRQVKHSLRKKWPSYLHPVSSVPATLGPVSLGDKEQVPYYHHRVCPWGFILSPPPVFVSFPLPWFFSVLSPYFLPCNSHFPYGFHSYPVPILSAKIISSETLNMAVHIVSMGLGGKSPSAMNEGRTHFSEPLFQAVCCLRKALPAPFTLSPWLLCFLLHLLWVRARIMFLQFKQWLLSLWSGCFIPMFPMGQSWSMGRMSDESIMRWSFVSSHRLYSLPDVVVKSRNLPHDCGIGLTNLNWGSLPWKPWCHVHQIFSQLKAQKETAHMCLERAA